MMNSTKTQAVVRRVEAETSPTEGGGPSIIIDASEHKQQQSLEGLGQL